MYVRLPIIGALDGLTGVDLLVWTTTPWTLVSNTAVAVQPDVTYVVARTQLGTFVVAEPLLGTVLGEEAEVLAAVPGSSLEGVRYRRSFELVDIPDAHFVITADYVTTGDGTGLVHQAPAFGADDLAACRRHNLPVVNPIGPDGHFLADVGLVGGTFFKDADPILLGLDPHRPYIDDVTFACPTCGAQATRVSEVIDAWFDSGSMPFAGIGYPYVEGSVDKFENGYPAQFICEAIDQTRGWFYTLMAIGTLVFDRSSYENVAVLGHIMAED
ncbi:MAG: class I tRNA ligase family protein, partial [Thermocrispum sp.]